MRYPRWVSSSVRNDRSRQHLTVALALTVLASACAHAARPTISGAQLYAQVQVLQTTGQAVVGSVPVRKGQVLTTGSEGQTFLVEQVIENCHGGDPASEVDCTLALLLEQRFIVSDHAPSQRGAPVAHEDRSGSMLTAGVVIGLGVAAAAGLIYGVATCEFAGCKAVFGVPLVLIGGVSLFALGRD